MAEGQADREVLFVLKAEAAKGADKVFQEFGAQAAQAQQRMDRDAVKGAQTKLAEQEKALKGQTKATQQAATAQQKAYEQAGKEQARAASDMENAQRKVTDSFHMGAEGAIKMARGLAMVGLVGEKDLKKVLDGLIKIQAATDIVRGGLTLWRALSEGVAAYGAATMAAQSAEIALRGKNAAAIGAETAALAGKAGANAISAGAGAAGSGAAGAAAGGGAFAVGAAKLGMLALKVTGLAAVAYVGAEAVQGVRRAFGDTSKSAEGFTHATKGWIAAAEAAKKSTEALSKAEAKRTHMQQTGEMRVGQAEARADARRARAELDRGRAQRQAARDASIMRDDNPEAFAARRAHHAGVADVWESQKALNAAQEAANAPAANPADRAQVEGDLKIAQQEAVAASDRMQKAAQDRLGIEEQIAAAKIDAADKAIDKAQKELDLRKDAIKAEEDRLKSAEERFGQMSQREQAELIRIKKKADSGQDLRIDEAQKLDSLGTRGGRKTASDLYRKRAKAAGFDANFGGGEKKEISRLQKEAEALTVKIKDQREFKVKIETDVDAVSTRLAEQIRKEMEVQAKVLEAMVDAKLQEDLAGQNRLREAQAR